MATSGSFSGNTFTIGNQPNNYIFTNWQLASQNTSGNYSTINWQTYFHFNGADADLNNGNTNSNVGMLWQNTGLVHAFTHTFTVRDITLASGTFTIGHDANGNQNLSLSNSIDIYQIGTSSGSGSWALPRIPLAPGLYGMSVDSITTQSARLGAEITSFGHGTSATLEMFYKLHTDSGYTSLGAQADAAGYNYWTVTGLTPATLYDYICNVTNNNGDFAQFPSQSFTTLVNNTMAVIDPF
jgi:hypothetical protein